MERDYEYDLSDLEYYDDDDDEGDSNRHFYDNMVDPDMKFERTKEYVLKNKIKIDDEVNSVTWLEQVDAISILAGYNKDTLQYFFKKLDYNTLVENNVVPLFYEEDGRCQFDVFYCLDKNTAKTFEWQDEQFELKFEKDGKCKNDKDIRKKIVKILDDIEDYAMEITDPGHLL